MSRNPSGGANVDSLPVVFFSKATLVFDATEAMSKVREGVGVWGVGGFDCCCGALARYYWGRGCDSARERAQKIASGWQISNYLNWCGGVGERRGRVGGGGR